MKTKKLILPKNNIVDINEHPLKAKPNELDKVPEPTGFRIVLFPLLLKKKTKAGLHLTDETIEQSQIATNICKVLKVGPDAYKDKKDFLMVRGARKMIGFLLRDMRERVFVLMVVSYELLMMMKFWRSLMIHETYCQQHYFNKEI